MKLYIRDEYFGSIVYNPRNQQYYNLNQSQTELLKTCNSQVITDPDIIKIVKSILGFKHYITRSDDFISSINLVQISNNSIHKDRLSAPLKCFFNITKRCNLFCKHCYNDSGHMDSPELSGYEVVSTLKSLVTHGIFKITIAGGEPLFHPDFDTIIKYCNQTDLAISIITNGICIPERRAILLGNCKNITSITVSLDGALELDNDSIRGEGSFQRTLKGIQLLRKHYHQSLAVRITLMQSNIENIHLLPSILNQLGIKEIKVNSINAYGRAKTTPELLLSSEEYLTARDRLYNAAKELGMTLEVPAHKYQRNANDQIGLCKAGEETFEIDGDGSCYPCSFAFGHFLAGNLRRDSFESILNNLQSHSINNEWCYSCKGRGGKAEKVFGTVPALIQTI